MRNFRLLAFVAILAMVAGLATSCKQEVEKATGVGTECAFSDFALTTGDSTGKPCGDGCDEMHTCDLATDSCIPIPPGCGNGELDFGEDCEYNMPLETTCEMQGFVSGDIACTLACTYDTTSCVGVGCGNGIIEAGEDCDGDSSVTVSCTDLSSNFVGGDPTCNPVTCLFDTTSCKPIPVCGNGIAEDGEACDGADIRGMLCTDFPPFTGGGLLTCDLSCEFVTTACTQDGDCGDGVTNGAEDCDGDDLGTGTCLTEGFDGGGFLTCNPLTCTYLTGDCIMLPFCGDGEVTVGEACDGENLNGSTCENLDRGTGTLACVACAFDFTGCTGGDLCGNGSLDPGELCDGGDFDGLTGCADLPGFVGGTLDCWGNCTLNTDECTKAPYCGDGVTNGAEDCDGDDLGTGTCLTEGFDGGGDVVCNDNCTINVTGCSMAPTCGDDAINVVGELCDGTDLAGLACSNFPGYEPGGTLLCLGDCSAFDLSACTATPFCGDGEKNAVGELCDGDDMGDSTCESLGYPLGGTLECYSDCSFNTEACTPDPTCGDGELNGTEECDGDVIPTDCVSEGYDGGDAGCTDACVLDLSGCYACGDGVTNGDELCDGTDVGGAICPDGFSGTPTCVATCDGWDYSSCIPDPFCGDDEKNQDTEQCDGIDLLGLDCTNFGEITGTLACEAGTCLWDLSGCTSDPEICVSCVDDDLDGFVDAEDPDCLATECARVGIDFAADSTYWALDGLSNLDNAVPVTAGSSRFFSINGEEVWLSLWLSGQGISTSSAQRHCIWIGANAVAYPGIPAGAADWCGFDYTDSPGSSQLYNISLKPCPFDADIFGTEL